jgi:hypothetical protein
MYFADPTDPDQRAAKLTLVGDSVGGR